MFAALSGLDITVKYLKSYTLLRITIYPFFCALSLCSIHDIIKVVMHVCTMLNLQKKKVSTPFWHAFFLRYFPRCHQQFFSAHLLLCLRLCDNFRLLSAALPNKLRHLRSFPPQFCGNSGVWKSPWQRIRKDKKNVIQQGIILEILQSKYNGIYKDVQYQFTERPY